MAQELFFNDSSNYVLSGGAATGAKRYFLDTGNDAIRLRCNSDTKKKITFSYTFADGVDVTKAGFRFTGLNSRMGTTVSISTDGGTTYTPLYTLNSENSRIPADRQYKNTNIVSAKGDASKTDGNMYDLYYEIGQYLNGAKSVSIQFGFANPGWSSYPSGTSSEGADIFGSVAFYSKLDLTNVNVTSNPIIK